MARLIIVSGGQSGVDRAALDAALACGLDYEGWCPQGGWAEDFPSPPGLLVRYPLLLQTPLKDPVQRTQWNVRDADACLILTDANGTAASRGSKLAERVAARYGKPLLVADIGAADAPARVRAWLDTLLAKRGDVTPVHLAIGGPRESEAKGIYRKARYFVGVLLDDLMQAQEAAA
jgi:Circularly permutated YpsA SLOG family